MDEEYLFLNTDFKSENVSFNVKNKSLTSSPSVGFNLSQSCISDDEGVKLDVVENGHVSQLRSCDKLKDRFNTEMSPDDFMFFESQECSFNQELQETMPELDASLGIFSPSKCFDLFCESEGDDFKFMNCSNSSIDQSSSKELKHKECKKKEETQNKILLNGVLNPRTLCPSLPRIKQVGTVTSCGTILRQSASMPGTRIAASRMKVPKSATPDSTSHNCSNSSTNLGRQSRGTYSPLEDHRYYARVKRSESPPPLKKRNFNLNSSIRHSKSNSSSDSNKLGSICPKMSILETFLRATCPLDPNKGSDATLATEGMLNLCIQEAKALKKKLPLCSNGDNNLLKKLLTNEIDSEEAQEHDDSSTGLSNDSPSDDMAFTIDSPLIDGFGLDAGLSIDEKGIYNIPDCSSDWQEDYLQMGSMIEFEDCVKLQDHQDDLCMQHYASSFL